MYLGSCPQVAENGGLGGGSGGACFRHPFSTRAKPARLAAVLTFLGASRAKNSKICPEPIPVPVVARRRVSTLQEGKKG
jgi:hypothetical protein